MSQPDFVRGVWEPEQASAQVNWLPTYSLPPPLNTYCGPPSNTTLALANSRGYSQFYIQKMRRSAAAAIRQLASAILDDGVEGSLIGRVLPVARRSAWWMALCLSQSWRKEKAVLGIASCSTRARWEGRGGSSGRAESEQRGSKAAEMSQQRITTMPKVWIIIYTHNYQYSLPCISNSQPWKIWQAHVISRGYYYLQFQLQ